MWQWVNIQDIMSMFNLFTYSGSSYTGNVDTVYKTRLYSEYLQIFKKALNYHTYTLHAVSFLINQLIQLYLCQHFTETKPLRKSLKKFILSKAWCGSSVLKLGFMTNLNLTQTAFSLFWEVALNELVTVWHSRSASSWVESLKCVLLAFIQFKCVRT